MSTMQQVAEDINGNQLDYAETVQGALLVAYPDGVWYVRDMSGEGNYTKIERISDSWMQGH